MIVRIWHGWTTPGNADKYEALLKEGIFVGIQNRHIRGFKSIQLLRRSSRPAQKAAQAVKLACSSRPQAEMNVEMDF